MECASCCRESPQQLGMGEWGRPCFQRSRDWIGGVLGGPKESYAIREARSVLHDWLLINLRVFCPCFLLLSPRKSGKSG